MNAQTATVHADGCDGACPRWLAVGAPTCLPYPCRCATHKADAPEWLQDRARREGTEVRCWWRTKAGQVRSRCPCWGRDRDGMPGDCCSHHSANPRYAMTIVVGTNPDPDAEPFMAASAAVGETDAEPLHDVDMPPGEADPFDDWDWPVEERRQPYVRRWKPEEITCPCVLAYQHDKRTTQVHCVDCHRDFSNVGNMAMHRRSWSDPCRDPVDITDCWTGLPLMANRGGVWAMTFESTYVPAGWTPGQFHATV